jgi:hypothetical protein
VSVTAPCAVCGKTFEEASLLFSDAGRVCGSCEADLQEDERASGAAAALIGAPPFLALFATLCLMGMCVPVFTFQVFSVALGGVFGMLSVLGGGMGFQQYMTGGAPSIPQQGMLAASAAMSIVWGASAVLICLTMGVLLYWKWSDPWFHLPY